MVSKTDRLCNDLNANGLPINAALDVLADPRCHAVVERLARENPPMELDELSLRLTPEIGESSDRVALRLHHVILPKFDDVGLVTYDPTANVVTLDEPGQRMAEYLDRTPDRDETSVSDLATERQ
jgi:hypothetical protein